MEISIAGGENSLGAHLEIAPRPQRAYPARQFKISVPNLIARRLHQNRHGFPHLNHRSARQRLHVGISYYIKEKSVALSSDRQPRSGLLNRSQQLAGFRIHRQCIHCNRTDGQIPDIIKRERSAGDCTRQTTNRHHHRRIRRDETSNPVQQQSRGRDDRVHPG